MKPRTVFLCIIFSLAELVFHYPLVAAVDTSRANADDIINNLPFPWAVPDSYCGPRCLWQIAYVYGRNYSLNAIASLADTQIERGTTLEGMVEACTKMGLEAKVVKTNIRALARESRVAIMLLYFTGGENGHYVILDKIDGTQVRLIDGNSFRHLSLKQLELVWRDGYAILIGHNDNSGTGRLKLHMGGALKASGALTLLGCVICVFFRQAGKT